MTTAFDALRAKLGIPPGLEPEPEPPVTGPVWGDCPGTGGVSCPGSVHLTVLDGPVWVARCDRCEYSAGVPARLVDPRVGRRRRFEAAGLPARYRGVPFVEDDENRPALEAVRSWLGDADPEPEKRVRSLLPAPALYGLMGTGKSHLLAAVCSRLVNEFDLTVLYRSARALLRELQRFEFPAERDAAWNRATRVEVLALDDLGAPRSTEWSLDTLADLLDERYNRELPVLVATNYPPQAWDVFDARSESRLRGMTFGVELRGPDRRRDEQESHA